MNLTSQNLVLLIVCYMVLTIAYQLLELCEKTKSQKITRTCINVIKLGVLIQIFAWYFPAIKHDLDANGENIGGLSVLTFILFTQQFSDVVGELFKELFRVMGFVKVEDKSTEQDNHV